MYGYVYKTTCLVNSIIYVGQKKSPTFLGQSYLGSGLLLRRAVEKYGEVNFQVELLEECDSQEQLNECECYWIELLHATDRSIGYNITLGAAGGDTFSNLPEELKEERLAKIRSKRPRAWVYKGDDRKSILLEDLEAYEAEGWTRGASEAERQRLRQERLTYIAAHPGMRVSSNFKPGVSSWNKGISPSDLTRQKLREANLGKKQSPETCARRSASMKRKYQEGYKSPTLGITPHNKGERGKWIWMWRPGENIHVSTEEVETYEAQGYQKGRKGTPRPVPWNKGISRRKPKPEPISGKVWVHRGTERKLIPLIEVEHYIAQGYQRGCGKRSTN